MMHVSCSNCSDYIIPENRNIDECVFDCKYCSMLFSEIRISELVNLGSVVAVNVEVIS